VSTTKESTVANRRGTATAEAETPEQDFDALDPAAKIAWAKQAHAHLHPGEPGVEEDHEWLDRVPALREEFEAAEKKEEAADAAPAVPPELPPEMLEGLPPAVAAFIASQQAQTSELMKGMFALVEKQAGQTGREVTLEGRVDELVQQLSGTVSEGPPPKNPLPRPVVFISKGRMFKANRKSRHRTVMPNGEQYFTTGICYDFAPNGRFETVDPSAAEWLRKRPGMNVEYWEETAPPHTAPDASVLIERIIDFTLELDDASLAALQADELASHKRPVVLAAIKKARRRVQGFQEQEATS
jgi:hypothetical protein